MLLSNRATSVNSLPRELVVELPLSSLLHQNPDDEEPRGLCLVYGAKVHGGRGRAPAHLVHFQGVDGDALYLGRLLTGDPGCLVCFASHNGPEVGVGLLEVTGPYSLVVTTHRGRHCLLARNPTRRNASGACGTAGALGHTGVLRRWSDAVRQVHVGTRV